MAAYLDSACMLKAVRFNLWHLGGKLLVADTLFLAASPAHHSILQAYFLVAGVPCLVCMFTVLGSGLSYIVSFESEYLM